MGPGALKGLNRLFNCDKIKAEIEDESERLKVEEQCVRFLDASQDLWFKYFEIEPLDGRKLNLMALENCLCEISKYLRVYYGQGGMKQK